MLEKQVVYLIGDWTNQNPDITEYLKSYGRSGVPIYVYYPKPIFETGQRPKAIILPQILTPSMITEILNTETLS
jgi:thiol:disulfide interchange protein DsbD